MDPNPERNTVSGEASRGPPQAPLPPPCLGLYGFRPFGPPFCPLHGREPISQLFCPVTDSEHAQPYTPQNAPLRAPTSRQGSGYPPDSRLFTPSRRLAKESKKRRTVAFFPRGTAFSWSRVEGPLRQRFSPLSRQPRSGHFFESWTPPDDQTKISKRFHPATDGGNARTRAPGETPRSPPKGQRASLLSPDSGFVALSRLAEKREKEDEKWPTTREERLFGRASAVGALRTASQLLPRGL